MTAQDSFYTAEEIRERQSISTLVFYGFRPLGEGALAELAQHGLRRIELLESPDQYDMTDMGSMRALGETFRANGIEVGAYHAHRTTFGEIGTEADRQERVDLCRRQIDTMLELGGRVWGCHAGQSDASMVTSYRELARHVEGTGAAITVENFSSPGVEVEDRIAFLNEIDHPQVGMILDIGHVRNGEGINPMTLPGGPTEVLELCGRRLLHIHMHGFKDGRDHHPPLCDGDQIQWLELFQMLRRVAYPGWMNFEPIGDARHANTLDYTRRAPERIVELAAGSS